MSELVGPNDSQRLVIAGRTGTGKTWDAMWNFAGRSFTRKPWVLTDGKGDPYIAKLEKLDGVKVMKVTDRPPKRPGIYIIRPRPQTDDEALNDFLWSVWDRGNTGLYFDEGYLIPKNSPSLAAICTQGRTKKIPLITLTQRPVRVNPFIFSEADFMQIKQLTRQDDIDRIAEWGLDIGGQQIPPYHSLYYDVGKNITVPCRPVPGPDVVLPMIAAKLGEGRTIIL